MRALIWLGRRFARVATNAVVRWPGLWRLFRPALERQFDWLAPRWESLRSPGGLASLDAALEALETPPGRALDLGTGTGAAAFATARRWPEAEVVGVDLSHEMIEEARRRTPLELQGRVRFEVGDSSALPFPDASFDLLVLVNMIPFFDEIARVVRTGGYAVISFSSGSGTPIYVAAERLRTELGRRGFEQFADVREGVGTALLARKAEST
jgi:SAM-dependent methyltransferase